MVPGGKREEPWYQSYVSTLLIEIGATMNF